MDGDAGGAARRLWALAALAALAVVAVGLATPCSSTTTGSSACWSPSS
jgi:hypothetical protein